MGAMRKDELRRVFQYLTIAELGHCAAVCRFWNETLTEDDGVDAEISVWRLKWEARWWTPWQQPAHNDESSPLRAFVRSRIENERQLAHNLREGRFESSCESQSWLLAGNDSPVVWLKRIESYIVTVHKNGQAKIWRLPFRSGRPKGKEIIPGGQFGKVESVAEIGNKLVLLGSWDGTLRLVQFSATQNKSMIEARVVQNFRQHPRPIFGMCANPSVVITACGDLIRTFPVISDRVTQTPDQCPLQTTTEARIILGHTPEVNINLVQFGSRDDTILSCSADHTLRLWNYVTGECLQCLSISGFGGPAIVGCNRYTFVVKGGTLKSSFVSVRRFKDGGEIRRKQMDVSKRIQTIALHEQFVILGTKDGHLDEINLLTGESSCRTEESIGSCPKSIRYVGRNALCAIDHDHRLLFLERKLNKETMLESWAITRKTPIRLCAKDIYFDTAFRMLLVISSGYLVRAFVFKDDAKSEHQDEALAPGLKESI